MYIGIDVGATKIKGIIFDKGNILKSIKIITPKNSKDFSNEIIALIETLKIEYPKVKGIGICFPGSVNRKKGIVIRMPNLPEIKNINIIKNIREKINLPIKIENDGKCAAIAELLYGLGKGKKNIIALTLGTGIGGGTIVNNTLCIGRGNAGEVGHLTLFPDGIKCTCGCYGCFEAYAASKAIMRMANEQKLSGETPLDIENLARNKNKKALEIYKKIGYYLGIGIADLIKIFDPEIITISGSISNASDLFLNTMNNEINKRVFFKPCNIKQSKIKDAPVVGAAALFEYESQSCN